MLPRPRAIGIASAGSINFDTALDRNIIARLRRTKTEP